MFKDCPGESENVITFYVCDVKIYRLEKVEHINWLKMYIFK